MQGSRVALAILEGRNQHREALGIVSHHLHLLLSTSDGHGDMVSPVQGCLPVLCKVVLCCCRRVLALKSKCLLLL